MKLFCFIYFFSLISFNLQAQIIEGRVLDYKTHQPIVFANIYFNGTIITGATTDTLGYFSLKRQDNHIPFYVSYMGYKTQRIQNYNTHKNLVIYLKPAAFKLPFVELKYSKSYRRKKERIFKREFLGTTSLAHYCTIENLNQIRLVFSKDKKTLYGYSNKPIVIDNRYLGYKIKYYLNQFYYRRDTVFFQGSYYFKEKEITDSIAFKKIKKHRKSVYQGSKMHFIRALYNNRLKEERFTVLEGNRLKFVADSVLNIKHNNYIKIKDFLIIYFRDDDETVTKLYQLTDSIYISKNGYYSPYSILWKGHMGNQRIPELLPFNYNPEKD